MEVQGGRDQALSSDRDRVEATFNQLPDSQLYPEHVAGQLAATCCGGRLMCVEALGPGMNAIGQKGCGGRPRVPCRGPQHHRLGSWAPPELNASPPLSAPTH